MQIPIKTRTYHQNLFINFFPYRFISIDQFNIFEIDILQEIFTNDIRQEISIFIYQPIKIGQVCLTEIFFNFLPLHHHNYLQILLLFYWVSSLRQPTQQVRVCYYLFNLGEIVDQSCLLNKSQHLSIYKYECISFRIYYFFVNFTDFYQGISHILAIKQYRSIKLSSNQLSFYKLPCSLLIIILSISQNGDNFHMTTFGQTTIHSKLAKFEKTNDETNTGRVVKGVNTQYGIQKSVNKTYLNANHAQSDIMRQIQILPKSKLNINRKMKNKRIIPNNTNKNQQIVLMESSIFPAIYFKKTSLRNILKQFSFPNNFKQLVAEDPRNVLIYQIISNLFSEINFYIFNLISGQNIENNSYYIFFSDCETLPFTKCCNAPVFLELQENGSGKILCNSTTCQHSNLAEFLINFDDGKKLWPNIPYFAEASFKDKQLKTKISKLIINGKYKKQSLVQMVQDTSKQIVGLFYQSKKMTKAPSDPHYLHDQNENTFVTGAGIGLEDIYHQNHDISSSKVESQHTQQQQNDAELLQQDDSNIETLKMKLKYITKRQTDINKKLSKSIVEQSKIFQHNFDIIRKIDQQMLKNRNAKTSSKITFPQLMNQIQRAQKSKRQSQSKTFHN